MNRLPLNVWILSFAQALMMSVSSIVVFVGGIIGAEIAPSESLATFPVASIIVGTATTVIPVTMIMRKLGRKTSFLIFAILSVLIALSSAYFIHLGSFYLVCLSFFLFGSTTACVMQFRFAAMESVDVDLMPKAASAVLLGGIAAAFIGPEIALLGKDIFEVAYTGSFILLAGLYALSFLLLLAYKNSTIENNSAHEDQRPLLSILNQRVFWVAMLSAAVGYMVMSFIMTATPVSMHVMDGHSLNDTKVVIQSHILAMFLPSLIAGWMISKIGVNRIMIVGLVAFLVCVVIAYSGHHFGNYWVSLILLGIGWNFLFIGGTTLLPQSYRSSERFKVQATNDFVVFAAQATAALSAGWFVFSLGWETVLLITVPVTVFQIVIILLWIKKENN